jgi:signal transduction histidine kinase
MIIGARVAIKGSSSALFFTLGFGWFLCGSIIFMLTTKGALPLNSITFYAVEIGGAFEAIFLSLGLAQRMRDVKVKSEHAQKALLESNIENLKLVSEYSTKLESEVKARTAELIQTQQKLIASEKLAALGVFTAGMAHEINKPANFVSVGAQNTAAQLAEFRGFVSDLLSDDPDPEITDAFDTRFRKLEKSNATIKEGISRIENVVKQLRADHPEGDTGMQPANVVASLDSTCRTFISTQKSEITLSTDYSDRPSVPCLIAELQQVFLALLSNATHAIEDASASPDFRGHIMLTSRVIGHRLEITVRDNGIGIPEHHLENIFDPFFTTKVVGRGAGLGLSMARDVMQAHNGTLVIESVEGHGTTCTLTLPIVQ